MVYKDIKIAHFIKNSSFANYAYDLFESVAPGCNDFFISPIPRNNRMIKNIPVKAIKKHNYRNPLFRQHLNRYDFIVFHSLNKFDQNLISCYNNKFVWIGMGYDYYYDLIYDSIDDLLFEQTRKLAPNFISKDVSFLKKIFRKCFFDEVNKKDILKRVDYFSPVLEEEYEIIKKRINGKIPKYLKWGYGSNTDIFNDRYNNKRVNGNDILLGNSATLTNNHIDAICFLKDINIGSKKVICPLSYGNRRYADYIDKQGRIFLEDSFVSLMDYLPKDQYFDKIISCSNVIMNHVRQQGKGNITVMLYFGAKVFLNKANPLYNHYCKEGITIYSMDELYSKPSILDIPLSRKAIENNRAIIRKNLIKETPIERTEQLIETVLRNK